MHQFSRQSATMEPYRLHFLITAISIIIQRNSHSLCQHQSRLANHVLHLVSSADRNFIGGARARCVSSSISNTRRRCSRKLRLRLQRPISLRLHRPTRSRLHHQHPPPRMHHQRKQDRLRLTVVNGILSDVLATTLAPEHVGSVIRLHIGIIPVHKKGSSRRHHHHSRIPDQFANVTKE